MFLLELRRNDSKKHRNCKANFGYGGSDADKFQKSYESLAVSLSLSGEYLED